MLRFGIGMHEDRADLQLHRDGHVVPGDPFGRLHLRRDDGDHVLALVPELLVAGRPALPVFHRGKTLSQLLAHNGDVAQEKDDHSAGDLIFDFPKRIVVRRIIIRVECLAHERTQGLCATGDAVDVLDPLQGFAKLALQESRGRRQQRLALAIASFQFITHGASSFFHPRSGPHRGDGVPLLLP